MAKWARPNGEFHVDKKRKSPLDLNVTWTYNE